MHHEVQRGPRVSLTSPRGGEIYSPLNTAAMASTRPLMPVCSSSTTVVRNSEMVSITGDHPFRKVSGATRLFRSRNPPYGGTTSGATNPESTFPPDRCSTFATPQVKLHSIRNSCIPQWSIESNSAIARGSHLAIIYEVLVCIPQGAYGFHRYGRPRLPPDVSLEQCRTKTTPVPP